MVMKKIFLNFILFGYFCLPAHQSQAALCENLLTKFISFANKSEKIIDLTTEISIALKSGKLLELRGQEERINSAFKILSSSNESSFVLEAGSDFARNSFIETLTLKI